MRAMILDAPGQPLWATDLPVPTPNPKQVLLRVHACGVCRTDLLKQFAVGDRVGVPWLGHT